MKKNFRRMRGRVRLLAAAACWACAGTAMSFEVDLGDSDLSLRWDNTIKYTAAWRVKDQSPGLTNPAVAANLDDGDRNFDKGLISNRIDLLSEMDLIYARRYGLRLSGAGWYDQVYNDHTDNSGFPTAVPNHLQYTEFTAGTKRLHGRKTDLLDAFVFGGFDVGNTKLNVRLGRHSVLWGESLFFGSNAIAGGMAPVDVIKLLSVPGTQFKEAIRPVPQVSAQWQLTKDVSLGAFYQFKWEENRLPAVGSYFSSSDPAPDGGELLYGPAGPVFRLGDQKPKDRGQGGVQLRFSAADTDFGLYGVRFHNKGFQQVVNMGGAYPALAPQSYRLAYHEGVVAYGASASRTFGEMQLSAEASIRRNQDLASSQAADVSGVTFPFPSPAANDNSGNPAYAVGKTAHINVSTIWTLPSTPLAREASFTGEVIWNRALSVDKHASAVDPNSTRDAYAMRVLLEPTYRQVLSGLDLGVPIGLSYSPRGSRSRALGLGLPAENGGDMTVGLNASYLDAWRFSIAYTHFYGAEKPTLVGLPPAFSYGQSLKDRDFLALSARRTF